MKTVWGLFSGLCAVLALSVADWCASQAAEGPERTMAIISLAIGLATGGAVGLAIYHGSRGFRTGLAIAVAIMALIGLTVLFTSGAQGTILLDPVDVLVRFASSVEGWLLLGVAVVSAIKKDELAG